MQDEIKVEKILDDGSIFDKAWFFLVTNLILLVAGALLGYLLSEKLFDLPNIVMFVVLVVLLAMAVLIFYIYRRIHGLTRRQDIQVPYTQLLVRTVTRPSTFILIDSHCLLWQINELVSDPQTPNRTITRMHGMFVIQGPENNEVIRNFVKLFNDIESRIQEGRPFGKDDLIEKLRRHKNGS